MTVAISMPVGTVSCVHDYRGYRSSDSSNLFSARRHLVFAAPAPSVVVVDLLSLWQVA